MKRHLNLKGKRIISNQQDRFTLSMISILSKKAVSHLSIVKPETLLEWQRRFIKNRWAFKQKKRGRKPIPARTRRLIMQMKNDNLLWGCRRISEELGKLSIDVHHTTVNRIIQTYRKQGKIQSTGSWQKFLKSHWDSLYGMDFMTIDTLFGKRLYLLIILELKSRKIVRYNLAVNPSREFVKQRIQLFSDDTLGQKTLIYDNAPQFTSIDYDWYGIHGVNTSTSAPDMNAYTERVIGSIRREALDRFLLFSEKQIRNIISEYIEYYNTMRPHQAIGHIPDRHIQFGTGTIRKSSIVRGLHHHYFRSSA